MLHSIRSRVQEGVLLHQTYKPGVTSATTNGLTREDISPAEESIQGAWLIMENGKTFKPHKHIKFMRDMPMAQEAWIVMKGTVKVTYYDLDDNIIQTEVLEEGDATFTYRGGHNYQALEDNTIVYELKTGPYMGQACDKVFIE